MGRPNVPAWLTPGREWPPRLWVGVGLTAVVAACTAVGWLEPLERTFLDWRFQLLSLRDRSPPGKVVYVDIGDRTLQKFGRWQWPRARIAALVDELSRAGAEAIGLDMLFYEPQPSRYVSGRVPVPLVDGPTPTTPGAKEGYVVDDDAVLASTMERAGNVILPVHTTALSDADSSDDPRPPPALERLGRPVPGLGLPHRAVDGPIPRLAQAAAATGFVDYESAGDAVVRTLPLWRRSADRVYPQFGVSLACQLRGVDIGDARISEAETVLPGGRPSANTRAMRIPHLPPRRASPPGQGRALLRWSKWAVREGSGDPSRTKAVRGWQVLELRKSRQQLDVAVLRLASVLNMANTSSAYVKALRSLRTGAVSAKEHEKLLATRRKLIASVLKTTRQYLDQLRSLEDLTAEERTLRKKLEEGLDTCEGLRDRIARDEKRLREQVEGNVCLVGLVATGLARDVHPTPVDAKTTGARVHGAMANAALSGDFVRRAALGVDLLLVLALSVAAAAVSGGLSPVAAFVSTVALVAAFNATNVLLVLGRADWWVAAAAPTVGAASVWSGVTLFRLVTEQRTKARITGLFKSYVSQDLVDYLVEHPELVYLAGEEREMTCLFADLAGFTELSERLGPQQSVRLLNSALGTAARQLMDRRALVNKFLGDGIMAFWGAPVVNPNHATDACHGALSALGGVRSLDPADLPVRGDKLTLRIGITTGPMMVGDFGAPPDRSDYTVIGDTVNLASRLEAANKQLGTRVLISQQTYDQMGSGLLARPIGRLVVTGRSVPEPVYELINTREAAADHDWKLVRETSEAVRAFQEGQFGVCEDRFAAITQHFGPSRLADLYRSTCQEHRATRTSGDGFDGALVLPHK